jgi:hypothetical protein
MTINFPSLTDIRNWCHSLAAILGVAGILYGFVIEALHTSGVQIPTQYAVTITQFGALLVLASKGIDSLNNAISPGAASIGQTPPAP